MSAHWSWDVKKDATQFVWGLWLVAESPVADPIQAQSLLKIFVDKLNVSIVKSHQNLQTV